MQPSPLWKKFMSIFRRSQDVMTLVNHYFSEEIKGNNYAAVAILKENYYYILKITENRDTRLLLQFLPYYK